MHRIKIWLISLFILVSAVIPINAAASGAAVEADLAKLLAKSLVLVTHLKTKADLEALCEADLQPLREQYNTLSIHHQQLKRQFESRLHILGDQALSRHRHAAGPFDRLVRQVLALMQRILENPDPDTIRKLLDLLNQAVGKRKEKQIFGSLPYRPLDYAPATPVTQPVITPAYETDTRAHEPEDLKRPNAVPDAQAIAALAESLQWNPVSIYEWVKNNVATQWYYGSMKGAAGTLRQGGGNDLDQAALLIALLRAAGYPARYVHGVIEFFPDLQKALNLTGTRDASQLAAFFRKAGIPCEPVLQAGEIVNYRIEHIWVEALIPWDNHRGAVLDDGGPLWVPLDTSIKGKRFSENSPPDLPEAEFFNTIREQYLQAVRDQSPLDFVRSKIADRFAGTQISYEDLLRRRTIDAEVMNILPAGLQFKTVAVTGEYADIPDNLTHKVNFTATSLDGGTLLFNETLAVAALSDAVPSLQYEPETVEDQETINAFFGLDYTPPYLIRLRPVLVSGENRVAVGQSGFAPGETFLLKVELISPAGVQSITNVHQTGDICVIAIAAQDIVELEPEDREEKNALRLLQEVAADYIRMWNEDEAELAALLRTALVRPIPGVATVGSVAGVDWLLDVPVKVTWQGVFMDADLRTAETIGGYDFSGADAGKLLLTLSGLHGSYLEGDTLKKAFGVESVSTAHLLGAAARAETAIVTLDRQNIDALLPGVSLPGYIKADLTAAVEAGYIVTTPAGPVTVLDWTGYGYLKEDPATKASGWMLSGAIAGGMTAGRPGRWDDYFVQRFIRPNTDPGQTVDPEDFTAAALKKIAASDFQDATVGAKLARPLEVMVLDRNNRPVADAEVTFTVTAGGGRFENQSARITVASDYTGIARTPFYVGEQTSANPTYAKRNPGRPSGAGPENPHYQQVGENLVSAEIAANRIALRVPFTAYGFPDKPATLNATISDSGQILALSGHIKTSVSDRFGNPVSNQPLTFTVEPAESFSQCEKAATGTQDTQLLPDKADCLAAKEIFYGACPEQNTSVDVLTNFEGAVVYVIGGGIPGARNTITVTCGSLSARVERRSVEYGNCDGKTGPVIDFFLANISTSDGDGHRLDAARVGDTFELAARIHYLREEEEISTQALKCRQETKTCEKIIGARKFYIDTDFLSSEITFNGQSGTPLGNGVFSFSYPVEKGLNTIAVTGRAEIPIRYSKNSCEQCLVDGFNMRLSDTVQRTVYGVDIEVPPQLDIAVDETGFALCDVNIGYTISPADYTAADAGIVIYENGNVLTVIPVENKGHGFGTIARGFHFDPAGEYYAKVRLNSNKKSQIESDPIILNPGAVEISHITIQDFELHQAVLPGDRVIFSAGTEPAGRTVRWSVTPERPDIDVRMDAVSGALTVGKLSGRGWVRVRAEDSVNPCIYRQAWVHIGCLACDGDAGGDCAQSAVYDLGSIDVKIGLGRSRPGNPAGHLVIRADKPSPILLSPAALSLSSLSPEVEERLDARGQLRQVRTHHYLADIVAADVNGYDIFLYNAADITDDVDGLYVAGGEFEKKWTLSSSNAETEFVVTETSNGATRTFEYHYNAAADSWLLSRADGLSIQERRQENSGGDRIVTETRRDQAGSIASQIRTTYHAFAWGEEIIQRTADPQGAARTTRTEYYTDKNETDAYGRIRQITNADGSWSRYEYDGRGRISQETGPWLDASPGSATGVRVITYDYTPVDSADTGLKAYEHRARTISEFIDGILATRTYHAFFLAADGTETAITERISRQNALYGDGDNQRSVTITHPKGTGGPESGRVERARFSDGRITSYTYETGTYTLPAAGMAGTFAPGSGGFRRTIRFEASEAAPDGIPYKSTRSVTIEGESGQTLLTATEVYTGSGFERLSRQTNEYDEKGRLTAVYNSDGTRSRTGWDCCTKASETDAEGIATTYDQYDGLNRVVRLTRHSVHGEIASSFTYDAAGRQLSQTTVGDGLTRHTAAQYDADGRLRSKTDSAERTTRYQYPDPFTTTVVRPGDMTETTTRYFDGRTKSVTGNGVVPRHYTYGINSDGTRWTQVTTGAPGAAMWERTTTDLLGRTILVERPGYDELEITRQYYDAAGRLIRTSSTGQADTLYLYDDLGEPIRTGLDVDGSGALEPASMDRITDTDTRYIKMEENWWQQSTRKIYADDNNGSATTVSTRRRQITGLAGGVISKSVALDIHGNPTETRTTLDPANQTRVEIIDFPDADIDAQKITRGGLLVSTRSKTGLTVTYGYDGLGRRISVTDPRTGMATTHYDDLGQVAWIEDAAGRRVRFGYDAVTGRNISRTDALGKITRFDYNPRGQVVRVWGDVPYPVSYAYDIYGRKTAMTTYRTDAGFDGQTFPTAAGDTTRWHYHPAAGLPESKVYADGTSVRYTYSAGGRLHTRTWAREHNGRPLTTTYTYDPATAELTRIDYSDDTADIVFTYDRLGRQTQVSDAAGVHSFDYTDDLQLHSESTSGIYDYTLTRTYETSGLPGRSNGFKLDGDYSVNYGYDNATGRFKTLSWQAGGHNDGITYAYLPDSDLLDHFSTQSGRKTRYAYDAHRNLTTRVENRHDDRLVSQYDYQYDRIGRRTSTSNSGYAFAQVAFSTYGYNDRSELTQARRYLGGDINDTGNPVASESRSYRYDPIGNTIQATAAQSSANYAPANDVNQYTAITRGTEIHYPAYDPDGNLTAAPDGMHYTYNAENRLIRAQPENPGDGDIRVDFLYDYMGRRIKKAIHTYQSNQWTLATTHLFVYDGWNLIKQSTQPSGHATVESFFVWGLDMSQTLQGAGGIGGLLATVKGASTYHYLFDANGNVGQMIDAADGVVAAHYEYDPFGNIVRAAGNLAGENPYRFSTKYFDGDIGLYYYGYRYYSSEMGRWIRRDPLAEDGGLNLYQFVTNNPVQRIDLYGLNDSIIGEIVKSVWYAVGQVRMLPGAIADSYSPQSIGGQLVGTGLYTTGEVISGVAFAPYNILDTGIDFFKEPSWETAPVIGSIIVTTHDFREDKNIVTFSRAYGAYSGGILVFLTGKVAVSKCKFDLIKKAPKRITDPKRLLSEPVGANPHLEGGPMYGVELPKGYTFNQAVAPGQKIPGAFGTPSKISSLNFVRNELAVIPKWKPVVSGSRTVQVERPVRAQISIVGPQESAGVKYPGGRKIQIQILEYDPTNPFVKFIGKETPLE